MPRFRKLLAATALVPFALTAAFGGDALATGSKGNACYQWVNDVPFFNDQRFRLNVERHGRLTSHREFNEFGHPTQKTYSLHGKHVGWCDNDGPVPFETMTTVSGTVVVARPRGDVEGGAHMGFQSHAVRDSNFTDNGPCVPITFDCTSTDASATPNAWTCFARDDDGIEYGPFGMNKLDPPDERCSIFENGSFLPFIPTVN